MKIKLKKRKHDHSIVFEYTNSRGQWHGKNLEDFGGFQYLTNWKNGRQNGIQIEINKNL